MLIKLEPAGEPNEIKPNQSSAFCGTCFNLAPGVTTKKEIERVIVNHRREHPDHVVYGPFWISSE